MRYFKNIRKGIFINRPNRFIVECTVNNAKVRAYLPNPGRLWELFFPGSALYLTTNQFPRPGGTEYTVVAVDRDGSPVMLHTHVNNLVAGKLIEEGRIPGLEGATIIKPEITINRSRFDFLLRRNDTDIVLEVKSCTLVSNRIAMFPDAVTLRGNRHLQELAVLFNEGKRAVVLFLVHWPRAEFFMPEWHTDLELSKTMLAVKDRVEIKAMSVEWLPDLTPGIVREMIIPWDLIEQEAHDRGSYIFIIQLKRDRRLLIGGLGEISFRKGYYCYVGSAKANLSNRIERHQRLRKKMFRHIDYLRDAADFHAAIPIKASEDLECEIASALRKISDWDVPAFGSSDCGCESHLFGMTDDPIRRRSFIDMLLYFRMDRLEKYLNLFGPLPKGRG